MIRSRRLQLFLTFFTAFWLTGTPAGSSELSAVKQDLPGPKLILALSDYVGFAEPSGSPISFALYSDRTVIYRDRKNPHVGFLTGTVDEDAWRSFQKIVDGLPEVKTDFAFSLTDKGTCSVVLFNDGKCMRRLLMWGPIAAQKTGRGLSAQYSTSKPAISLEPVFGGGEVPQGAIGAWYEMHYFVPKDVHPWAPDKFLVHFNSVISAKSVAWQASWPKVVQERALNDSGYCLTMPGKCLIEFERLFNNSDKAAPSSGKSFSVSYEVSLPSQDVLVGARPLGHPEEPIKSQPRLPYDFLQTTSLADVRKIAKDRGYDMWRNVPNAAELDGIKIVGTADVIEELCQSNELEKIDTGLELMLEAKRSALRAASLIASANTPEVIKALIVRHVLDGKFLEIIIPLIQESVARGADYDDVESVSTFWRKLRTQGEPLAWLPLHRTELEQSVSFPRYRAGGSATELASNSINAKLETPFPGTAGTTFTSELLPFDEVAAARCVRSWKEHSNGKYEAKLFETSRTIDSVDISAIQLLKLRLDCLAGATPGQIKVEVVPPAGVFTLLSSAASNGGAYPPGEAGAYGRLSAWKSLAAITGVGDHANFADVYAAVKQCGWCSISSTAKWFYNVAWDFGIVCVRPDKRHIVVLAATDED